VKLEGEKQTRRDLIDKQLERAGRDPADYTKESDLKARDHRTRDETL